MTDDNLFHFCQSKAHRFLMDVSSFESDLLLLASLHSFRTRPEGTMREAVKCIRDLANTLESLTDEAARVRNPMMEAAE